MLTLSRSELAGLPLSEKLRLAVEETFRIKDQRALRRHYKRVGKLLRSEEDLSPIEALLDKRSQARAEVAAEHHRLERWRERLIHEGDAALAEYIDANPQVDRQQLRTLVRAAKKALETGKPDAARRLFRFLREGSH